MYQFTVLLLVVGHWMACLMVMIAELEQPCYRVGIRSYAEARAAIADLVDDDAPPDDWAWSGSASGEAHHDGCTWTWIDVLYDSWGENTASQVTRAVFFSTRRFSGWLGGVGHISACHGGVGHISACHGAVGHISACRGGHISACRGAQRVSRRSVAAEPRHALM